MEEIGLDNKTVKLKDLWDNQDLGVNNNSFSYQLERHDSLLLKASPIEPTPPSDTDTPTETPPTDTDSGQDDKGDHKVLIIAMSIMGAIIVLNTIAL